MGFVHICFRLISLAVPLHDAMTYVNPIVFNYLQRYKPSPAQHFQLVYYLFHLTRKDKETRVVYYVSYNYLPEEAICWCRLLNAGLSWDDLYNVSVCETLSYHQSCISCDRSHLPYIQSGTAQAKGIPKYFRVHPYQRYAECQFFLQFFLNTILDQDVYNLILHAL